MRRSLLLLCVLLGGTPAFAAEEPPVPVQAAPIRLAAPAQPDAVADALEAAHNGDSAQAVSVAQALGVAGGYAAADGLRVLVKDREAKVRVAALRAVTRVGLRSEKLAALVHGVLATSDRSKEERLAAIAAIGAIGDGGDMEILLKLASTETDVVAIRSAAFRAMAEISGAKLPYVHARWSYWWRKQSERRTALLEKAVAALDDDPEGENVDIYADVIETNAWFDLPYAEAAIARWLGADKRALRRIACRLAGTLRLADLTDRIASLARNRGRTPTATAARAALKTLGYTMATEPE